MNTNKIEILARLIAEARAAGIAVREHCPGLAVMSALTDDQAQTPELPVAEAPPAAT